MADFDGKERQLVLQALYDNLPYEIHVWRLHHDKDGITNGWNLVHANPSALQVWGKSLSEVVGKSNEELFPQSNSTALFLPLINRMFSSELPQEWEEFFPDTHQILRMTSIPLGETFISVGADVSDYRHIESALAKKVTELNNAARRLRIATEAAEIGIWEYDIEADTYFWDDNMYRIYGFRPTTDKKPIDIWSQCVEQQHRDQTLKALSDVSTVGGLFKADFSITKRDTGQRRHIAGQGIADYDKDGNIANVIGVNIDVTDRKEAEKKVERLAYFDPLTELPNRSLIEDRLKQAIARSGRTHTKCGVLFIDLDDFKLINDTGGHALGDEVLFSVARRFEQIVRDDDTVGRFGGDEFVVILNNLPQDPLSAAKLAGDFGKRLAETIELPMQLSSGDYVARASIGISVVQGPGQDSNDALRQADLAMYRAKESGRNTVRFFDPDMESDVLERVGLERDLESAIELSQLELHYQPQVEDDGRVRGAEALLRWAHPQHGYISPVIFIPIAERSGQIHKLGRWVLRQALADLANRLGVHVDDSFVISVNVSAVEICDSDFHQSFSADVLSSGIDPSRIMLELTESVLGRVGADVTENMIRLKELGIKFALDDFGTGYSSLTRLKELPINELKIDQSFVRDITQDSDSRAIARSVVALGESMELSVIAEGVETLEEQQALKAMGCSLYQGYFFSRPLDADAFVEFLQQS